jgi:hypothetical protein
LRALTVGRGGDVADPDDRWAHTYGVDADGAVLLRPDGHLAWRRRCGVADAAAELEPAMLAVLGRAARSAGCRPPHSRSQARNLTADAQCA